MTPAVKKPLPLSFKQGGFVEASTARRYSRMLIGTEGASDSGKTEWANSAPGPIINICLDRGYDAMLENPNPPETRCDRVAFKNVLIPVATQGATPAFYLEYWRTFYVDYLNALSNPDAKTVVVDGDSDSWELQRLAEFGKLTQIPSIMYTNVNAARRAMINRAYDSGKVVIFTNKLRKKYEDAYGPDGKVKVGSDGKPIREWKGEYERSGFDDQDYLYKLQLRHLYKEAYFNKVSKKEVPQQWGIRILKCKKNTELVGTELWGAECNFAGLMGLVYPEVSLSAWGL